MSAFVFDSNILIDALNMVGDAQRELLRAPSNWISRITWIEIMAGAPADAAAETELFLGQFQLVELTEEVARRAALIRAQQRRMKLPDAIIWASAQVTGRILVTRNTKDFPVAMPGIRVPYTL